MEYAAPGILIAASVAGFSTFAYVATARPLTDLEGVFLQAFSMLTGFAGTFMAGRQSAQKAARAVIKPHARSAFRRLVSQYQSLHRMATIIASSQSSDMPDQCRHVLGRLQEIAITQINTADAALADWEDIVPDEVRELRQALSRPDGHGGGQ